MPFPFHRRKSRDRPRKKVNKSRVRRKGAPLPGDKSPYETRRERSGEIAALQRYRFGQHMNQSNPEPHFLSHKLLVTEKDLREVVQEETSTKEEKSPGAKSKDTQERLDSLNTKYWLLVQKWWYHRSCLQDRYQLRAFELWRSHPRWYMHPVLVEDCAGRLGCCSRGCGCCRNRKLDPTRALGLGHCTFECGCCRKARGFDIPKEDMALLKEQCRKDISHVNRHRIRQVSIWGITGDSYESPFDLVDEAL